MKLLKALFAALAAPYRKEPEAVETDGDKIATTLEEAVASVRVAAANGDTCAFISSADMDYDLFKEYTTLLREAFEKDRARTGVVMPRVVILPPGVTVDIAHKDDEQAYIDAANNTKWSAA
jgi:hypothetical protein